MREAELYPPIKAYLEAQGYEVKAEIGACDVMARRGYEPAVVVEMKVGFSLALVMQGVARQAMFDDVYLAVPLGVRGWGARYNEIVGLCRRLVGRCAAAERQQGSQGDFKQSSAGHRPTSREEIARNVSSPPQTEQDNFVTIFSVRPAGAKNGSMDCPVRRDSFFCGYLLSDRLLNSGISKK